MVHMPVLDLLYYICGHYNDYNRLSISQEVKKQWHYHTIHYYQSGKTGIVFHPPKEVLEVKEYEEVG